LSKGIRDRIRQEHTRAASGRIRRRILLYVESVSGVALMREEWHQQQQRITSADLKAAGEGWMN